MARPGNLRSMSVCQRLGMEHHGRKSRYYGVEVGHFTLDALESAAQPSPEPG